MGKIKDNVEIHPYLYHISEFYRITDLIVTSAGAITLAEIAASGLPAILIPKAYTTENHQEYNARSIEKQGAARVLLEKDLSGERLTQEIEQLLSDKEMLDHMSKASKALGKPLAAKEIVDIGFSLLN